MDNIILRNVLKEERNRDLLDKISTNSSFLKTFRSKPTCLLVCLFRTYFLAPCPSSLTSAVISGRRVGVKRQFKAIVDWQYTFVLASARLSYSVNTGEELSRCSIEADFMLTSVRIDIIYIQWWG